MSEKQQNNETATNFQLKGVEIKDSNYVLLQGLSIASGSFGKIYLTRNTSTNEICVTKLIRKDNPNAKLRKEYDWYRMLGTLPGLPKIYHFGECGPYDAMVMELLGPNLEQLMAENNYSLKLRTTTQIAIMILEIMRSIHSKKIIFCNVKPENFCLGKRNTAKANKIHIIGLTNAKLFETSDSKHIPKIVMSKEEASKVTPRYMSLNAHKGKALSRRDDLESIGYMLLYFLHGKLPWQGLPNNNNNNNNNNQTITNNNNNGDKYENIFITKKMIQLDELCANLPPEYYHYMLYVRSLKFAQEPNYRYLITMFTKLLNRINMDQTRLISPTIDNLIKSIDIDLDLNNNNNKDKNNKNNNQKT